VTLARERLAASRVAHLATVRPDGAPHVVPIVFALDGDRVVTAIDDKPKRSTALQRLANIESESRVSLLADRYDEDWTRLWWVRVDGVAEILRGGGDADRAIDLLADRYGPYRERRPSGAVIRIEISRWVTWPDP